MLPYVSDGTPLLRTLLGILGSQQYWAIRCSLVNDDFAVITGFKVTTSLKKVIPPSWNQVMSAFREQTCKILYGKDVFFLVTLLQRERRDVWNGQLMLPVIELLLVFGTIIVFGYFYWYNYCYYCLFFGTIIVFFRLITPWGHQQ